MLPYSFSTHPLLYSFPGWLIAAECVTWTPLLVGFLVRAARDRHLQETGEREGGRRVKVPSPHCFWQPLPDSLDSSRSSVFSARLFILRSDKGPLLWFISGCPTSSTHISASSPFFEVSSREPHRMSCFLLQPGSLVSSS